MLVFDIKQATYVCSCYGTTHSNSGSLGSRQCPNYRGGSRRLPCMCTHMCEVEGRGGMKESMLRILLVRVNGLVYILTTRSVSMFENMTQLDTCGG